MAEQAQRPRCVDCGRFVPQALRDRFPGADLVCTPCVDEVPGLTPSHSRTEMTIQTEQAQDTRREPPWYNPCSE